MKYLKSPTHDDFEIIEKFANRKALSSYPMLLAEKDQILAQYLIYYLAKGNALELNEPLKIEKKLADALRTHYSTQPAGLDFIDTIRNKASPDVCPMCGSLGTSEVDHVIPKDIYPEYSFFSRNLVPACDCNGKKGVALKDTKTGARILHPYFDEMLSHRLAYVGIKGDFNSPDLSIEVMPEHSKKPEVIYHINSILKKTNVLSWAAKTWANILRTPESYFQALIFITGDTDNGTMEYLINQKIISEDKHYQTPNTWNGMLLYGMKMNADTANFLAHQVNGLRDGSIMPL